MKKVFCDVCKDEIIEKESSVFENTMYIRLGSNDKLFGVMDVCDDCIIDFQNKFSKYIKNLREVRE
ncbi:hypothetical protein LCGC14_1532790 [marine sediment metagenome]|uniref:Uncharacterized protein n=1 Tax=marine sediment metagenome TaxID=412755 RepID=A0A0F9IVG5_9ZZZZ